MKCQNYFPRVISLGIFSLLLPLNIFLSSCQSTTTAEPPKSTVPRNPPAAFAPQKTQLLRMNLHSEPSSIDPRLVRDIPSVTTGKMFFDGLTRIDLQGQIIPSVAKSITISPDQKTYTFHLKDTVWSNGTPVTAQDFEYSWKKVLMPNFPSEYAHQLFCIKNAKLAKTGKIELSEVGIYAKDAETLVVELENPYPYFLQLTAFPICFPVSMEAEKKSVNWAESQAAKFICNGPFKLIKWSRGSELKAERNPLYWDADNVRLQTIILTMIEDEHTELNMYENDELDWAGSPNSSIPPEALPSLKSNEKTKKELFISPIAGTYCYKFNTKEPPFNNVKMRKAFAYAINRQSLIDNILQANQAVATSLLPPCMNKQLKFSNSISGAGLAVASNSSKNDVCYFKDDDREKAIAYFDEALAEMGYTKETLPPITLIFSKSEKHQKIAQANQQVWNNTFGIKINLQSYEWNTYIEKLAKHNYQVGGRGWVSDISDPKTLLEIYKFSNESDLGGNNDTQWENQLFIQLLDQALIETSMEKRQELLRKAESLLMEEMPITPLFHSTACYLKKTYVKDVYMSELCDLDFKYAYIADSKE